MKRSQTEGPVDQLPSHVWMLLPVALIELCASAAEQLTLRLGYSEVQSSVFAIHSWVAFIGAIPAGWLGDRYLGARRAIETGALLMGAGCIMLAWFSVVAISLGLAAGAIGIALLRGNTLVLLSRAYAGHGRRRLEGFVWVVLAAAVGRALAGVAVEELSPGITAAVIAVLLAGAARAIRRAPDVTDVAGRGDERPAVHAVRAAALVLTIGMLAVALYAANAVDRAPWNSALNPWLFPASAFLALVIFILWWRHAAPRMSLADNRRIATFLKLAVYAGVFCALGAAIPVSRRPSTGLLESFLGLLFVCLPLFLRWRAHRHPVPSAAGAFSVAFYLQSVACLAFATMAVFANLDAVGSVQSVLEGIIVGASGLAGILMAAAGWSAATALAPAFVAGAMLGLWRTSVTIGGPIVSSLLPLGTLDRDPQGTLLMAAAAACVLAGMLLHADRHVLARDELAEPPLPAAPGRLYRAAMSLSGAVAVLGVVWVVVGRGAGGEAVAAVARTVRFEDARRAFLPAEDAYGFVRFAPGSFLFGSDPAAAGGTLIGSGSTGPLFALGGFYVGRYEVTVAQYRQCVTDGPCRPADPRAIEGSDEWPVRHVSWFEANQYCLWLEQRLLEIAPELASLFREGLHVALPSEPEWERAAGGRGVEGYPWRGPLAPVRANYSASARLAPVPVGEFTAGATTDDIHDLSGNVAEWTRSEYRPYPYDAADGREDPSARPRTRVIRGGSFYDDASLLKVTARQAADPSRGYEFVGFRVVITRFQPRVEAQPQYQQSRPPAAAR